MDRKQPSTRQTTRQNQGRWLRRGILALTALGMASNASAWWNSDQPVWLSSNTAQGSYYYPQQTHYLTNLLQVPHNHTHYQIRSLRISAQSGMASGTIQVMVNGQLVKQLRLFNDGYDEYVSPADFLQTLGRYPLAQEISFLASGDVYLNYVSAEEIQYYASQWGYPQPVYYQPAPFIYWRAPMRWVQPRHAYRPGVVYIGPGYRDQWVQRGHHLRRPRWFGQRQRGWRPARYQAPRVIVRQGRLPRQRGWRRGRRGGQQVIVQPPAPTPRRQRARDGFGRGQQGIRGRRGQRQGGGAVIQPPTAPRGGPRVRVRTRGQQRAPSVRQGGVRRRGAQTVVNPRSRNHAGTRGPAGSRRGGRGGRRR